MVWQWKYGDGLDPLYRKAVNLPHETYVRADIRDPLTGETVVSDLPFGPNAQVRATLQNRVARTLQSFQVDRSWFPVTSAGDVDWSAPLAPAGNRLDIYHGIRFGNGSIWYFPAFSGPIKSVQLNSVGTVTVAASDEAQEVVDANFESGASSVVTNTCGVEFERLIGEPGVIPGAARFGESDPSFALVPALTWDSTDGGRASACDQLASAEAMVWYPLADGSFVRRLVPWTRPGVTPAIDFTDGGDNYGLRPLKGGVSDWTITVTREGVSNAVSYLSERQDGTAPAGALVRDMDPSSPTYYLGKFGRKPTTIQNQAAQSQGQCLSAAQTALKAARSITAPWDPVTVAPDASLELGDAGNAYAGSIRSIQVIAGFDLGLRENGTMSLHMRQYAPVS
jgi:hypothetical protein